MALECRLPPLVSPIFVFLCLALLVAQFVLPYRYAFAPLLVAVCHFRDIPVCQLGVSFSIYKLVILGALIRAMYERQISFSWRQPLDRLVIIWVSWAILSGFFHSSSDYNPITIRLSLVYDAFGAYLCGRSYLRDDSDFLRFIKCLALVVIPLAALMLLEKSTCHNLYGAIAGANEAVGVRNGRVRAMGPFLHPILAGTFGATAMLLLVPLRRSNPRIATGGAAACGLIVFSSASSGPIMALLLGLACLVGWRFRRSLPWVKRSVLVGIVGLQVVMQAPVWYLLARIDFVGGSTGWHRAELITSAVKYIDDWWLVGTDYTRQWMPYGVEWNSDQTDITNDYLYMGVTGGLPMMLLFTGVLLKAFRLLGKTIHEFRQAGDGREFLCWSVGCALFAHCLSFLSISYFDQSRVAFWMLIGALPGLCAATLNAGEVGVSAMTCQTGDLDGWSRGEPIGNGNDRCPINSDCSSRLS